MDTFDPSKALPPMGADPNTITFSGYSGGAYMSHYMHVIHSDVIKGVGLFNGGPYTTAFTDLGNGFEK